MSQADKSHLTTQRMTRILFLWGLLTSVILNPPGLRAQTVTQISEGQYHSLFLKNDGSMWAMGNNLYGALGDGTLNQTNRPEFITNNVAAVAAKSYTSMFLKRDGTVWGMGMNSSGMLGNGTYSNTNAPVMGLISNVAALSAGFGFAMAIKTDGSLWGVGAEGALGTSPPTPTKTNIFQLVLSSNVTAVSCGELHTLLLKKDSSLWGMGYNNSGQLGLGATAQFNLPTLISSNVTAISAGYVDSYFIKQDGSLWGMGINYFGELGNGDPNNNQVSTPIMIVSNGVAQVAGGQTFALFIKTDGTLWGMGWNQYGQLGDGTFNNTNRPEMITNNAATITYGDYHSLLIRTDGSLWATGDDVSGELGDGNTGGQISGFERIVAAPPNYRLSPTSFSSGQEYFSFVGLAGTNYALDRSFSLTPVNWIAQKTNTANGSGVVLFTNAPNTASNNFWRVRSVP
jgi:alpha-tubulin suppressor-like RCC1 family protein